MSEQDQQDQQDDEALLREHDEHQARVLTEAAPLARFPGHSADCQCVRCAVVMLRALGLPATLGPAMESLPHVRRALDRSHEGTEDSAA